MAKKAIVFFAEGTEEIEALTPVDYLRRAGVEVTLAAVGGSEELCFVRGSHGITVGTDSTAAALAKEAENASGAFPFDAVIVPGGLPGSTNIASDADACAIIRRMNADGRLVCAICAAPAVVLPATGALDGKAWTCYPGMESEAPAYISACKAGAPFVHDANLITGRGPGAAEEWAMEIVRTLCGADVAQKVHDISMQR